MYSSTGVGTYQYDRQWAGRAGTVKTRYLHKDPLGSITVITDESGADVEV